MRAKLALLTVTVVVFAPGWGTTGPVSGRPDAELAARMLAPTFDEATAVAQVESGSAFRGVDRNKRLRTPVHLAVTQAASSRWIPIFPLWIALAGVIYLAIIAGTSTARSPRAPPHLLAA